MDNHDAAVFAEWRLRRMRLAIAVLIGLNALSLCLAGFALARASGRDTNAWRLADSRGKERAVLRLEDNQPVLTFLDERGKTRLRVGLWRSSLETVKPPIPNLEAQLAMIGATGGLPFVALCDPSERARVYLGTHEGFCGLTIYGTNERPRARVVANRDYPWVGLFGELDSPIVTVDLHSLVDRLGGRDDKADAWQRAHYEGELRRISEALRKAGVDDEAPSKP
jgi:hypothetical protein